MAMRSRGPRTDRLTHGGIAERHSDAFKLQDIFMFIDAARGVDRQDRV